MHLSVSRRLLEAPFPLQQDNTDPFMGLEILNCLGNPSLILEELVRRPKEGYCPLPLRGEKIALFSKANTGQDAELVKQKKRFYYQRQNNTFFFKKTECNFNLYQRICYLVDERKEKTKEIPLVI